MFYTILWLGFLLIGLLILVHEQKKGSRKNELDEFGLSEKIRTEGMDKVGIDIRRALQNIGYVFKTERVLKNAIKKRIHIESDENDDMVLNVYYRRKQKQSDLLMFKSRIEAKREIFRYFLNYRMSNALSEVTKLRDV